MTLRLDHLGYTYPTASAPALDGVTASLAPGERVLVLGRSGCGKSTLLRLAAALLQRFGKGQVAGTVRVAGRDPATTPPSARAALVGFVSQDPGDQLVTGRVDDEVAFGCESAGWAADRVEARVPEMLAQVGLELAPARDPGTLSGGQQQRLVVAATLAVGAPLLLLDEPLAQLDPDGADALLARLSVLADSGTAVLLAEHRVARCLPWADRVWLMDGGTLVRDCPAAELEPAALDALGLVVPDAAGPPPVPDVTPRLVARDLLVRHGVFTALDGVSLEVRPGERVALIGANGAGKSTLLAALEGERDGGTVEVDGRLIAVPQDPDLSLFSDTVRDELAYGPREARLADAEVDARVARLAAALDLAPLLDRSPHALSRGERLRLAVGAALACEPAVLLLDEPTAGQDGRRVEQLLRTLAGIAADTALVFATHDVALARRHAHRVLVVDHGRIADGEGR